MNLVNINQNQVFNNLYLVKPLCSYLATEFRNEIRHSDMVPNTNIPKFNYTTYYSLQINEAEIYKLKEEYITIRIMDYNNNKIFGIVKVSLNIKYENMYQSYSIYLPNSKTIIGQCRLQLHYEPHLEFLISNYLTGINELTDIDIKYIFEKFVIPNTDNVYSIV